MRPLRSALLLAILSAVLVIPAQALAWPTNTDRIHSAGHAGGSDTVSRTWDNASDTGSPSSTMTFSADFTVDDDPPGTPFDWFGSSTFANVVCKETLGSAGVVLWSHVAVNSVTHDFSFANSLPLAAVAHMNNGHGATCKLYAIPEDGINEPSASQYASNYTGPTVTITTNAPAADGAAPGPPSISSGKAKTSRDKKTGRAVIATGRSVACPAGGSTCTVAAKLTATYKSGKKKKTATFGSAKLTTQPGTTTAVSIKFNKKNDKLYSKLKKLKFTLSLTASANGKTTTAKPTFTLKAPK